MKGSYTWAVIAGIVAVILISNFINQSNNNDTLAHENDCAAKLPAFQASLVAKNVTTGFPLDIHTYSDFLVAYSPSLNTCIAGYTYSAPDVLHGRSSVNENDYVITDLLTNKTIDAFSIDSELNKHPEIDKMPFVDSYIALADADALADYQAELSKLSGGKIP